MKKIIMLVGLTILSLLLISCTRGEENPYVDGYLEDTPIEDTPIEVVREQASDVFLMNDESVDAADIEVGLG